MRPPNEILGWRFGSYAECVIRILLLDFVPFLEDFGARDINAVDFVASDSFSDVGIFIDRPDTSQTVYQKRE